MLESKSGIKAAVEDLFDELAAKPPPSQCPRCGSRMIHLDTTFFSPDGHGKVWDVPLPVCTKC
jgi:hypothetical protein